MALAYGSELLKRTVSQSFWNTYYSIPDPFAGLVDEQSSTQSVETKARLGAAPMPEEWVGDRRAKDVDDSSHTITNKPFDATVKVDKKLVKFDQISSVSGLVANLGEKSRAFKTSRLSTALNDGHSTLGEDGQNFFDTDHADTGAVYTTAWDNDLTSVAADADASNATDLEFAAAVRGMFDSIYSAKDDRGDPFFPPSDDPSNFILQVPTNMRSIALRVMKTDSLTGPLGNDLMGTFSVRVNPFITLSTTVPKMYLMYSGSNHKPLVWQSAGGLELSDYIDKDSGDICYSATQWGNHAYGQHRCAVLHTFTT